MRFLVGLLLLALGVTLMALAYDAFMLAWSAFPHRTFPDWLDAAFRNLRVKGTNPNDMWSLPILGIMGFCLTIAGLRLGFFRIVDGR